VTTESTTITEEEFCRRFVECMVRACGETFDDGTSIREYAAETAPTYWQDDWQRKQGPEACAEADMSYWGE